MKKTERIISVILLWVISLSNLSAPVSYATQRAEAEIPAPAPQVITPAPPLKFHQPDSGSVLGASTSIFTIGTQGENTQMSASKRIPIRMEQLAKKVYATDENVTLAVTNPDNDPFTTSVVDIKGQAAPIPVTETNDGTTTNVTLQGSNEITPGTYTIKVTDEQGDVTTQDFSWGVLALNTDKSMYHPGETADISLGVLDDQGNMVCDAALTLQITNQAGGNTDTLSTDNKKILANPQCQSHGFSLQPDYAAQYKFEKAGTYNLQLTAVTKNGTHSIIDIVPVTNQIPFDVQRVSATRIYPPNTYPMTFNITAHKDFSGIVTETVPENFTITPATGSATVTSYTNMQTVYLNSNNPAAQLSQAIVASSSGGLTMPFKGNYPITQGFGAQLTDPTLQAFYTQYGLAGHDGIDFGVPMNTPLYAVDDGNITWSGPGDYGTTIIIQHGWGESYYGHLSTTAVTVGTHVTKGQLIGYSGESGEATGPHLHFGMKPLNPDLTNGYYGKVDPMPYLPYGQQTQQSISSLAPSLATGVLPPVLGASTSADTDQVTPGASDSASVSPTPTQVPTAVPTTSPTISQPVVSGSPTSVPTPAQESAPTFQIQNSSQSANENFSVLDKQILTSEQLANSADTQKVKVITWHVNLKKGQSTALGYDFQAPPQSPQFYLLGPMQFYQSGSNKVVFQEQHQWQIASDDVGVGWYVDTSGAKFNGYSWQYRKKIDINHNNVSVTSTGNTISYDATGPSSSGVGTTNATSLSWSHTVSGANTALLVGVAVGVSTDTGYSATATYDSVSMTLLKTVHTGGATAGFLDVFGLLNAPPGTNTVAITVSGGTATEISGGSESFQNVSQFATAVSASGNSGTASVTTSGSTSGDIVAGFVANGSGISTATAPSVSKFIINEDQLTGAGNSAGAISPSTGSNVTMAWTATSSDFWGAVAVEVQTASSPPAVDFMDSGGDATGDLFANNGGFWNSSGGTTPTVDASTSETGPDSIKLIDSASGSYIIKTGVLADAGRRVSAYFKFDTLPSSTHNIFYLGNSGGVIGLLNVNITSSGVIQLAADASGGVGTQIGSSGPTLSTGTWYRIDISYKVTSATNYSANVYVNGVQAISYSQTTGGTSLGGTGTSDFYAGLSVPGGTSDSIVEHMDDIYVDSGTDLSDPGNVHVTAKLPIQTGDAHTFTVNGTPTGDTTCTDATINTGVHCEYVNERPLNTTAFLDGLRTNTVDNFTIQGPASGDVNISTDNFIADDAWVYGELASGTTTCAGLNMINNTNSVSISFATTYAMKTSIINNTTYPSGQGEDVGLGTCTNGSGTHTVNLAEAGMLIAYEAPTSGSLTNFPVLVNLTSDADLIAHAQSSGADIVFTDSTGENLLPFEIESYSSGNLVAWLNVSSLSSTADTILYMYFGNPAATSKANAPNTWNSNYGAVYHFNGSTANCTTLGTPGLADSTVNALNGTNTGVTTTAGQICGGASFNGTSNNISIANNAIFNPGSNPISVVLWINQSTITNGYELFEHLGTDDSTGWEIYTNKGGCGNGPGFICFWDGSNDHSLLNYNLLSASTWEQLSLVKIGTTIICYLNGVQVGSMGDINATLPSATGEPEFIGEEGVGGNQFYKGSMDEFEYANTNLTPGWIQTEYNNQSAPGSFSSLGTVETKIYAPTLSQIMRHGQFFDSTTGTIQPFTF